MRELKEIILHCSATKASQDIGAAEIRDWHVNGNGWSDIGYHYVIRREGTIENGRPLAFTGAHCHGHNTGTIGICLVGGLDDNGKVKDDFTSAQFKSLARLIELLRGRYGQMPINGHCDYAKKACPVFSVDKFCNDFGIVRRP